MPRGDASYSYDQKCWDNEPLNKRGSRQSTSKHSKSKYASFEPPQHELLTLKEEMDRYRALSLFERHKREDEEYQRRLHPTSKKSSLASKRGSTKEYNDNRTIEPREPRIESMSCESKADLQNRTTKLVDSLMEDMMPLLQTYFEQINHVPAKDPKEGVRSSTSLIEEMPMDASSEHTLGNVKVPTTLDSSHELCEEICEIIDVKYESVERGKLSEDFEEISGKSELIVSESASEYEFSNGLTCVLFSVSSFVQVTQGEIELIMACSIPKSFAEFHSFYGVCLLGVNSFWCQFMERKSVSTKGTAIYVHNEGSILDFDSHFLTINYSSSFPCLEYESSSNSILHHAAFEGIRNEPVLDHLIDGTNHEILRGVFTFNSCSIPSYHLANDVPMLICPISGPNQAEGYFTFVGCKAVQQFPDLMKVMQPDFVLVPITYERPKLASNQLPVLKGSLLLNDYEAEITTFKSDFVNCIKYCDSSMHCLKHCVCFSCESLVLSLYESSTLCAHCVLSPYDPFIVSQCCDHCDSICHACLFCSSSMFLGHAKSRQVLHGVQIFPTCYQLGELSPYTFFIPSNTSFFVFDPGIDSRSNRFQGGGNGKRWNKLSRECSCFKVRESERAHWFMIKLSRRHASWLAFIKTFPELLRCKQAFDLRTNRLQEGGDDTILSSTIHGVTSEIMIEEVSLDRN